MLVVGCAHAGQAPDGTHGGRHAERAPSTASAAAPHEAHTPAALFMDALWGQDFQAAVTHFEPKMRDALSSRDLAKIWAQQTEPLGTARTWSSVERGEANGMQVEIVLMQFERGGLLAVISNRPGSTAFNGLWFRPAPAEEAASAQPSNDAASNDAYRAIPMTVGQAPFVLTATLLLPHGKGPFPGVVLVHGSGPQDQDGAVAANLPLKDLAEGLARRGIAVLRYHKRTYQYGRQLSADLTVDQEVVEDALHALATLEQRPEVRANDLFVVGHSLGAQLAPEIAARAGHVRGVVLLAPPGRAPWDVVLAQLRYLEVPPDQVAEAERAVQHMNQTGFREGALLGAPASYWKDLAAHDGIAALRRAKNPALILRGSRDYQVTEADLDAWRVATKGMSHVAFQTFEGLNHLFIEGHGKPGPAEYSVHGKVADAVLDSIAAFIGRIVSQ